MKAIILNEPGGTENFVVTEIPTPVIKEGEVLVKVRAIGINPVDIKTRKGQQHAPPPFRRDIKCWQRRRLPTNRN